MIKDMIFMIDQKNLPKVNVGEIVETVVIFTVALACLAAIVLS